MTDDRQLLKISGPERADFLQNLVTNDVAKLREGLVYAALLTPQGKYLADFFLVPFGDSILIDVDSRLGEMLNTRLNMYKLRANIDVSPVTMSVSRGVGETPVGAHQDPRHPELGWRAYEQEHEIDAVDWDSLHVTYCIPQTGIELTSDTFILEAGFEKLNGVDFKKGCYVGQEVTARMKHKTELKKGLGTVSISGSVAVGSDIVAKGKTIGKIFTQANGKAIAYLRFDRATDPMTSEGVAIQWDQYS